MTPSRLSPATGISPTSSLVAEPLRGTGGQRVEPAGSSCERADHKQAVGARPVPAPVTWPATARGRDQSRGGRAAVGTPRRAAPAVSDAGCWITRNIPQESRRRSRPGGVPSPHPGAACHHGPRRRRPGQGRPKAGPEDREAPLMRAASAAGSAGWPRQRPVRGRVQGPGRGAEGEAVPTPCELFRRSRTAYRVCRSGRRLYLGCCGLLVWSFWWLWFVALVSFLLVLLVLLVLVAAAGGSGLGTVSFVVSAMRSAWAKPRPWPGAGAERW